MKAHMLILSYNCNGSITHISLVQAVLIAGSGA